MFNIEYLVTENSNKLILDKLEPNSITKRLTIINKWFNTTTKKNEYKTSIVSGFYESNKSISVADNTLLTEGNGFFCAIPLDTAGYQTPKEYEQNPVGWTLKNDDYIVNGIVSEEFTSINNILDNYECMKITKVAKYGFGSSRMQHFEVWGQ